MYYNDLPPEIQAKTLEYRVETMTRHTSIDVRAMFVWNNTPEGNKFWGEIHRGNYEVFYERYPKFQNIPEIKRALRLNKLPSEFTPEQIQILEEKNIKYR